MKLPTHQTALERVVPQAKNYVFATIKPWNVAALKSIEGEFPGTVTLMTERAALSVDALRKLAPRYVFFPHWSWIVPEDILSEFECVCFHMTDVPYGRGGSPLQNLIVRGHTQTRLTALRMTTELDAGPVYAKCDLSLDGSASQIFQRAAALAMQIALDIARNEPKPQPQSGTPTLFERRRPEQSLLPDQGSLRTIYDHIRMLDAPTYPLAYLDHGDFRLEFSDASEEEDGVSARVVIRRR